MGTVPNEGEVKVKVTLVTDDAKQKLAEIKKHLQKNEALRKTVVDRINREGMDSTGNTRKTERTIADRLLERIVPKMHGYNPNMTISRLGRYLPGSGLMGAGTISGPGLPGLGGLARNVVNKAMGAINPFPSGGIGGSNVTGGAGSTLALAAGLYTAAQKTSKFAGLALAYSMKSGEAAAKTPAGQFLSDLNSTFSYINNYLGSFKDAEQRLADWDDAVAAVTGKLPDTQFYRPKFQRQALAERQFQDMVARNAAWTKAGALGKSGAVDQIEDAIAHSMSR